MIIRMLNFLHYNFCNVMHIESFTTHRELHDYHTLNKGCHRGFCPVEVDLPCEKFIHNMITDAERTPLQG